jgi:hypothetical protein
MHNFSFYQWSTIVQNPQRKCTEQYCMSSITASSWQGFVKAKLCKQYSNHKNARARAHYCAVSAVCTKSQDVYLTVCYNQWWASHLIRSIASHIIRFKLKRSHCYLFCPLKARYRPSEEVFSAKPTRCVQFRHHKEPYNTVLKTYKPGM